MRPFFLSLSVFIFSAIPTARPATAATTLPTHKWATPRQVTAEHGLSAEGTWLLAARSKDVAAFIARLNRRHNGILP